MLDFRHRLEAHIDYLKRSPSSFVVEAEIGDPVTPAEVARVQQRLGFQLDPRFLAYFQQANGWRFRCVDDHDQTLTAADASARWADARDKNIHMIVNVPSLEAIFTPEPASVLGVGTVGHALKILGGIDDAALRSNLRLMGRYDDWSAEAYTFVTVYASARVNDPVCLYAHDYGADLAGNRPVRARAFFELGLMMLGRRECLAWFEEQGADGDHPIVDLDAADFPHEPWLPRDRADEGRATFNTESIDYLRGKAGLRGAELRERPIRVFVEELSAASGVDYTKLVADIEALGLFEVARGLGRGREFLHGIRDAERNLCACTLEVYGPGGEGSASATLIHESGAKDEVVTRIRDTLLAAGLANR